MTDILKRALAQGKVSHAYLFTGPRGVGKTSIARILAHEINQLPYDDASTHLDIIEIDAASRSGVDDIRELRDKVQVAPVSAAKKVYIIDEVHMLSKPAFNALLKTLEEPPEHVVFILATTDSDKVPQTIMSRTQQFGFRLVDEADVVKHLKRIAKSENITVSPEALRLIAQYGGGSFRDSIGLLDQLSSLADDSEGITETTVQQAVGLAPASAVATLLTAYDQRDLSTLTATMQTLQTEGVQIAALVTQLLGAVQSSIVSHPERLPLLDTLLDVTSSSHPAIKLLTVLGQPVGATPAPAATPKSTAAPLVVTKPTETIQVLEREAERKNPTEAHVRKTLAVPTTAFDWQTLITQAQAHSVALHSVLVKCSSELHGDELAVYCRNAFYKKKLDDPKYRALLSQCMQTAGMPEVIITTIPTAPPPKDTRLAAVTAMMGGGEEVDLAENE